MDVPLIVLLGRTILSNRPPRATGAEGQSKDQRCQYHLGPKQYHLPLLKPGANGGWPEGDSKKGVWPLGRVTSRFKFQLHYPQWDLTQVTLHSEPRFSHLQNGTTGRPTQVVQNETVCA